jgi:hypothetical protein
MRDVGKSSFVEAMSTRKDSVFEKVIQEFIRQIMLNFKHSTISFTRIRLITRWMINNLHIGRIYVFERNCRVFKVEHNLTDPAEYPYDKQYENKLNKVQTPSLLPTVTVDINTCFLCKKKKKTFKSFRGKSILESLSQKRNLCL